MRLSAIGLLGAIGAAPGLAGAYENEVQVDAFIAEMTREHGFAEAQLRQLFAGAERKQPILDAISRPAERVKPWKEYRPIFITDARIAQGVEFWSRHAETLARAEREYGVPAQVIVAIIGVETFFGRNTGNWRVIDALATLGFDYPPRADFFRSELEQLLLLARENGISPLEIKGSYAGAIGIPQFMPSSLRRYGVDFDGDDRIDLRQSPTDAIGSVARFLAMHGWQPKAPIAAPVSVDGDPTALVAAGIKPTQPLAALAAQGVVPTDDAVPSELPAALIDLVSPGQATEYWAGFDNFYVITRYNRSSFYAMSVFQLAQALRAANEHADQARGSGS